MVDRIKQILEFYRLSPASFAEQIGINRSNLTHLFSGRNQPSLDFAKKILHSYPEIKTEWLIMGVGEMLRSEEDRNFEMKVLNEKKQHFTQSNPDLFANSPFLSNEKNITTQVGLPIDDITERSETKSNSREVEKTSIETVEKQILNTKTQHNSTPNLSKIVIFFSDNSFEVYYPKV
jgi:transcriptional regulator with XRE-family HTH domain